MVFANSFNYKKLPAYGCAECSNCTNRVDLTDPLVFGIIQRVSPDSNEHFYFILCDECSQQHFSLEGEDQFADGKRVLKNAFSALETHGISHGKAIITLTALIANNFDFAKALEDGVNLTPELHQAINSGAVDPYEIPDFLRELARSPAQRAKNSTAKSPASRGQDD
jgi:hypothetical protein